MKKSKFTITDFSIGLLMIDLSSYFISCLFSDKAIRHIITFVGIILVWGLILQLLNGKIKTYLLISILILVCIILISIIPSDCLIAYNLVYSSLCFFSFFIIFNTEFEFQLNDYSYRLINSFTILDVLLIFILYLSPVAYRFEDGRVNGSLALGMTNPNLTGIKVYFLYCIVLIFFFVKKKKLYIPLLLFLLFIIWMTKSRTAFISGIFVTACCIFKKNKFKKWQIYLCLIIPIIFILLYISLFNQIGRENLMLMGKPIFSGREVTYREQLSYIDTPFRFWLGNIGNLYFSNAHNGPLVILCSLGFSGLLVSYFCFSKSLIEQNDHIQSRGEIATMSIMLCLFILSCGEGSIFSGAFPGVAFLLLIKSGIGSTLEKQKYWID